jgi:ABC-type dipeptide/oligopeptide/nickel transport system ATPase subunit
MIIKNISTSIRTKEDDNMAGFQPQYRKATRAEAKACIALEGTSGKGKSGLALALAYYLADEEWDSVNAIDTENRSLDLFEGIQLNTGPKIGHFNKIDLLESHGYAPTNYLACIERSIKDGAKVQIVDSSTHMWKGKGGMLQIVGEIQNNNPKLNRWTSWGHPTAINEKDSIVKCVRSSEIHMISTIRMKEKLDLVDGKVISFGMEAQHMPDLTFEPDLVLTMKHAGSPDGEPPVATVRKSRYAILKEGETYKFDKSLILQLKDYLKEGVDIAELKEQQRLERIAELERFLDNDQSARSIYPTIKKQQGLEDKALEDFTLEEVRAIIQIVMA